MYIVYLLFDGIINTFIVYTLYKELSRVLLTSGSCLVGGGACGGGGGSCSGGGDDVGGKGAAAGAEGAVDARSWNDTRLSRPGFGGELRGNSTE